MGWERRIARLANRIDERVDELKRRVRDRTDARVVAFRGFGTEHEAFISGRVLADPPVPPAPQDDRWWRNLVHTYRLLESDEVAGAQVAIRFAGASHRAVADTEGYFRAWLRPRKPLRGGPWHEAELELAAPAGRSAGRTTGQIMIPMPGTPFGVISDLDDTVVRTDATRPLRMLRSVLLGNARTRMPFDGVAAFYRALHAGPSGADRNPIFYVSSSPWNLYDLLVEFLDLNAIPAGPLLLRDWGITPHSVLPTDHRSHKLAHIRQILDSYPLPFILIGDSGQRDPEIYREVVAQYPARILAIYIRSVSPDPLRRETVRALADEVERAGSALLLAEDTLSAARHAAQNGWIADKAVDAVGADPDVRQARSQPDATPDVLIE